MPGYAHIASMFPTAYDESPYAWIITRAILSDNYGEHDFPSEVGISGPSQASELQIATARLLGREFRMMDDDGEIYYYGKIWTSDEKGSETDFGPLDDFGTPNAGATEIQYKIDGKWVTL